jgi:histidinol-phosphatase (PHP family)
MTQTDPIKLVSIHGGHSGQFCLHARDTLEEVVLAYIDKGFAWVGITEHMPPPSDEFVYPEERAAGLSATNLYQRFGDYMATGRILQQKYADRIQLFIGMETETCTGSVSMVANLKERFKPDYLVGSLHHVNDHPFDLSPEAYHRATEAASGVIPFYCRYFDQQYQMLQDVSPEVVGHFDIVRIFDPDYRRHLENSDVKQRVMRNLQLIREQGAILDFNVRPLCKGASEPYVTESILKTALSLGIPAVPGDDSHGVDTVGLNVQAGITILENMGFDLNWATPVRIDAYESDPYLSEAG